jgi:hypothetical protein
MEAMRATILMIATLVSWTSMSTPADACTCLPPDMARSYNNADHVVHVRVLRSLGQLRGQRLYRAVLIEDAYKGCLSAGQRVTIRTASSSAACGVLLTTGQEYLLHGTDVSTGTTTTLQVGLCDANSVWSQLSAEHLAFLQTRFNCCDGKCACVASDLVQCFVDPCEVSTCDVEGAVCYSNYCGGCNAEWIDPSGALVCTPADDACADESREYVADDPATCARIRFFCDPGEQAFFDDCGCGCEPAPIACHVGGCSGQLCVGPGEPDITTCEWRPEYACYRDATCAVQPSGRCGWTPTPELQACLDGAS